MFCICAVPNRGGARFLIRPDVVIPCRYGPIMGQPADIGELCKAVEFLSSGPSYRSAASVARSRRMRSTRSLRWPGTAGFTSGATEANNHAILGAAQQERGGTRKRIIISSIEHKCVIAAAFAASDLYGFTIEVGPVDRAGLLDPNWLQAELDDTVLLVSVMAVNNEIGTIQDLPRVADS